MNTRPALLLAALLALPLASLAQPEPPPAPQQPPRAEHRAPPSPERMTEHMRKELGLDEAQAAKVLTLNQQLADGMKRLHDEHEQALRATLTPEQWSKFEAMRERHGKHHGDRRQPPPPPQ